MSLVPFDDRDGWIWLDGQFMPWREAKVHVLTHGLHYASAVFEGERMYGGEIFKLTEHTERLFKFGGNPRLFDPLHGGARSTRPARTTCARNGLDDCYVRPIAWRGSEMMGVSAQNTKIHVAIAAWDWPSYFKPEEKAKGIRLTWAKYKRPSPETAPTASKAAGLYMICTLSKHAAEREGFADAMMLDWRGYVAEATGANVFFVARRGDPHADPRLLPRRHHPPVGDGAGQGARASRSSSGTSSPRSWPASPSASSPAPPPR